jgi:hypothetical protein
MRMYVYTSIICSNTLSHTHVLDVHTHTHTHTHTRMYIYAYIIYYNTCTWDQLQLGQHAMQGGDHPVEALLEAG